MSGVAMTIDRPPWGTTHHSSVQIKRLVGSGSCRRPLLSMQSALRSASGAAVSPLCTRPTWARPCCPRWSSGPESTRPQSRTSCSAASTRSGLRRRYRAHGLARGRPSRPRSRHDGRPAMRLVPAGGSLRGPGRAVRHRRRGHGRRRAEHERHPDLLRDDGRTGARFPGPLPRLGRLAAALRRPGDLPVPVGRDDRREVGHQPRRHGAVRRHLARAGIAGGCRGALRPGDPARLRP